MDQHLPALLDLYMSGDDSDREWVRHLLHAHPTFRWALGRDIASPKSPAGADDAQKSGLDAPALMRQAATWSSDTPRSPPASSTRGLLLQFAERFGP